jgi:hypothetical protein
MGSISNNVQPIQNENITWLKQVTLNVYEILWHVPKIIDNSFQTKNVRVTEQQGGVLSANDTLEQNINYIWKKPRNFLVRKEGVSNWK